MIADDRTEKGIELVTAATLGMIDHLRALLDQPGYDIHYDNDLALRSASYTGYNEVVKLLVEKGANVNAAGGEALLYAAKRGDTETVGYLLSKGADMELMLRANPREIDQTTRDTLDQFQSKKLREVFEKNFERLKKPGSGNKFKLRKMPPSP